MSLEKIGLRQEIEWLLTFHLSSDVREDDII